MKNVKLLMIINPFLLISMLLQIVTGIAMGKFHASWAYEVHEINALALNVLFISHIILNWGWIKVNIFRIKK